MSRDTTCAAAYSCRARCARVVRSWHGVAGVNHAHGRGCWRIKQDRDLSVAGQVDELATRIA